MKNKLTEELALIALLSILIPTAALLSFSPLWWHAEPIKVFAGYLLGVIVTAVFLGAVSVLDERKERDDHERR